MHIIRISSVLIYAAVAVVTPEAAGQTLTHNAETVLLQELEDRFTAFKKQSTENIKSLTRHLMLQQQFVEERIRSDGDSGLKQVRAGSSGSRPYHVNSYTSYGVASGHDHANYDRTVGLGEFVAVLNGVEFRTRHNDYKIRMPSTKTKNWNQLEDIPFPPIPPSVQQKQTVPEQVAEMREYFKAFHEQDKQHRDWTPYFKPVMCYLEGGWTTNTKTLEEPFHSDRHMIEANSWLDLQEKIRYTSFSGSKNNNENFSYLPTTIVNTTEEGIPIFAQWNYRIVCHPIKTKLDLSYFRLVDDLATRVRFKKNMVSIPKTRAARFAINPTSGHSYNETTGHAEYDNKAYIYGKLDEIMSEIPGKDNYIGHLTGKDYGYTKYRADTKTDTPVNTAFYHRIHKVKEYGGEAFSLRGEGFSDGNLWVAETSSPHVPSMGVRDCHQDENHKEKCERHAGRFTYAIPLEVIWLTPLSTWNPYNVSIHDWKHRAQTTAGGRNGGNTPTKAYNGTSVDKYYLTPADFFHGGEINKDPADTAKNSVGVLDQHQQVRHLSASGLRFFLPDISGVGKIRTRYPIMPLHQEGSTIWKEMEALQDITMDMKAHTNMFEVRPRIIDPALHKPDKMYVTTLSRKVPPDHHTHEVFVTAEETLALKHNETIRVFTTEDNGHQHELVLKQDPVRPWALIMVSCDGVKVCFDWHGIRVYYKEY